MKAINMSDEILLATSSLWTLLTWQTHYWKEKQGKFSPSHTVFVIYKAGCLKEDNYLCVRLRGGVLCQWVQCVF